MPYPKTWPRDALGLAVILACSAIYGAFSDTLTMTAWYPTPMGIYSTLMTTDQAVFARDGGNVGIGVDAIKSSPAIQSKLMVQADPRASAVAIQDPSSNPLFFVAANGFVGVGTTNPQAALDIAIGGPNGGIKLAPGGTCASGADAGKIAMIGSPPTPQWCDGTQWQPL